MEVIEKDYASKANIGRKRNDQLSLKTSRRRGKRRRGSKRMTHQKQTSKIRRMKWRRRRRGSKGGTQKKLPLAE